MNAGRIVFEGSTTAGLDITLRYPRRDDVHALWEFINNLSRERTFILIQGVEFSLEDEAQYVERMLERIAAQQLVQILAFAGDRLIGNTDVALEGISREHVGGLGIAIAQPYRGQGLGRLLMQTVLAEAAAHLPGLRIVRLSVFDNNPAAIHLYRSVGFIEYGRLPGGILHRDQYVDEVYMYRPVDSVSG